MTARPPSGCGSIPVSSGPASSNVSLHLVAATTAAPGAIVAVRTTLQVASDGQRIIVGPSTSELLITQHGVVVGRSEGLRATYEVPLALRAGASRPAQVLPPSVQMSGCPSGTGSQVRSPLPAGEYSIVAVVGYRLDTLNSGVDGARTAPTGFHLVSEPAPITVR